MNDTTTHVTVENDSSSQVPPSESQSKFDEDVYETPNKNPIKEANDEIQQKDSEGEDLYEPQNQTLGHETLQQQDSEDMYEPKKKETRRDNSDETLHTEEQKPTKR